MKIHEVTPMSLLNILTIIATIILYVAANTIYNNNNNNNHRRLFCTTTRTSDLSRLVYLFIFVFNPWDLYPQGYKKIK